MPPFNPTTDIPSLTGKVILITGANSGLGEAAIHHYAKHSPSKIWMASRSLAKAEAAAARIRQETPDVSLELLEIDLASLESVKRAATRFNAASDRLDILQLNGGIGAPPHAVTADGYELSFGTNYLGHAALTQLLMPKLLETARRPGADVRVITMSSIGHKNAPKSGIAFDQLQTPMESYMGLSLYNQSMLARTHFAYKMAQKYPQITTVSLHPGTVRTSIADGKKSSIWPQLAFKLLFALAGVSPEEGAKHQVYLSVAEGLKNGKYYEPVAKEVEYEGSYDEEKAAELWEWTDGELRGKGFPGWI